MISTSWNGFSHNLTKLEAAELTSIISTFLKPDKIGPSTVQGPCTRSLDYPSGMERFQDCYSNIIVPPLSERGRGDGILQKFLAINFHCNWHYIFFKVVIPSAFKHRSYHTEFLSWFHMQWISSMFSVKGVLIGEQKRREEIFKGRNQSRRKLSTFTLTLRKLSRKSPY